MPDFVFWLIALVAGYFIGHIQFALIISKFKHNDDVRLHGSGNAGSTNMLRTYGLKSGLLTFAGDLVKGVVAVLLGRLIGGELGGYACGLGVVVGHCYPVLLQFKGGKGVASTLGVILMLNPIPALIGTAIAVLVVLLTHIVSLMSLIGLTCYTIIIVITQWGNWLSIGFALLLWLFVGFRHLDNIKRLITGKESQITVPKEPPAES